MKRLIVNADDFGLHAAVNRGIAAGQRDHEDPGGRAGLRARRLRLFARARSAIASLGHAAPA